MPRKDGFSSTLVFVCHWFILQTTSFDVMICWLDLLWSTYTLFMAIIPSYALQIPVPPMGKKVSMLRSHDAFSLWCKGAGPCKCIPIQLALAVEPAFQRPRGRFTSSPLCRWLLIFPIQSRGRQFSPEHICNLRNRD